MAQSSPPSGGDSPLGFSFRLATDALVTVGRGTLASSPVYNYDPITHTPDAVIELNPASFQGTNLGSAGVYVAHSTDPNIVSNCTKAADGEQFVPQPVRLNGVQFAEFTVDDGGAGTLLHWTSHRAVRDKTCYEIVEWLSWGDFENYEPGKIKQFNKQDIETELRAITQSFEF
ncbi:MAG: hypothetical protein QOI13_626 [Paraburkholderia sp.]|nr:hypothetical protein [Paraburkholderia sp.]